MREVADRQAWSALTSCVPAQSRASATEKNAGNANLFTPAVLSVTMATSTDICVNICDKKIIPKTKITT